MDVSGLSSLIEPDRLGVLLGGARSRFTIEAVARCASTNSCLLERGAQRAPSGSVLVCDCQTAGRGSRGRRWEASPEASLTFSVLWRFTDGFSRISGLSLGVGVAVVRALTAFGAHGVSLKWPNDILHRDAKLGGILVELGGDADEAYAVVGIGLNLKTPVMTTPGDDFMLPVAALSDLLPALPERNALLARLLLELAAVFDVFAHGGFAELRDEWQAAHAWQGRMVAVLNNGTTVRRGICLGADVDGALRVQTDAGVERCLSGDVSLRVAQ